MVLMGGIGNPPQTLGKKPKPHNLICQAAGLWLQRRWTESPLRRSLNGYYKGAIRVPLKGCYKGTIRVPLKCSIRALFEWLLRSQGLGFRV